MEKLISITLEHTTIIIHMRKEHSNERRGYN